ncbi:MAG: 2-succinyl-5-enolpyruvyl-6-hydroxy-3-cyclohexene-1-carboxylic-acid synthase [Actinomycetales bacterium]|nr:2-succinyl-5-enolpyruvyl-6-hydroxy-3-cyclohexene-1-carboxylic-acid synthase [Actinomycetales bacterium]
MNPSTAMARVLVDELVANGVTEVVLAPGSRSAALAIALADADARGDLRLHVRIDERSAGFLALGLAKVAREPVAVVVTSGTAVANLAPAVVEASYADVPVIVVTADRPAELRDTGASQTIDQARFFGSGVRWSHEVAVAEPRAGQVRYWRSVVARAVAVATEVADSGPVHLNVAFREPLVPDADETWVEPLGLAPLGTEPAERVPVAVDARLGMAAAQPLDEILALLSGPETDLDHVVPTRGVVVVGDVADVETSDAAIALAEACGWPLLSEPSGNARSGDTALAHGPLLLADDAFAAAHRPEIVVCVGTPGLSRSVLRMVREAPLVVVADERAAVRRPDPTRNATLFVSVVPEPPGAYEDYDDAWLDSWLAADARAAAAVSKRLDDAAGLTGPDVARTLWDVLDSSALLLAAASWPVRHLEAFARVRESEDAPYVVGNRGTSGIDGLVSTAWGAALAHQSTRTAVSVDDEGGAEVISVTGGTAYALLGDLAFLHDHNGLLVGDDEPRPDLVIVVVDNDGGGIFGQLEQAGTEHFERVFGTPLGLDLAAVARAAAVDDVTVVDDVTGLVHALDEATARGSVRVIVAKVGDRGAEAALLRDVQADVSAALADLAADAAPEA